MSSTAEQLEQEVQDKPMPLDKAVSELGRQLMDRRERRYNALPAELIEMEGEHD